MGNILSGIQSVCVTWYFILATVKNTALTVTLMPGRQSTTVNFQLSSEIFAIFDI